MTLRGLFSYLECALMFTMQRADALMVRIQSMPNSTCMFVSFKSTQEALEVLKKLSFVKPDSRGLALPPHILCEVFKTTTGASVIIGGTVSVEEYQEMFTVFNRDGKIRSIAVPDPVKKAAPVKQEKKPAWKFW
jgi:hypothetical protein